MRDITISFLGTTSGGGPTDTRNCSSLVLDGLGNSSLWMFDCAEGTVRQFATQPHRYADGRHLKMSRVTKIFITHMHADHTMGIITLLRNVLGIHKPSTEPDEKTPEPILPKVEIYGPRGMRQFVRSIFTLTHTRSADKYTVHELLLSGESASASAVSVENDPLHESELPGKDFPCDANGFWRNITSELCTGYGSGRYTLLVDAGPILHRDPCIGYIVREVILSPNSHYDPLGATPEGRNIVILGDTHDPSGLIPLINSPPTVVNEAETRDGHYLPRVSLLIHEATDAYIPPYIDPMSKTGRKRTAESVLEKALEKGHSTPGMAGNFARQIGAERLVLNHIGARFPAPIPGRAQSNFERFRVACIQEIERQAEETWGHGKVTAAWDYYSISVPPYSPVGVPDVATC
ncbi:hypothetical protein QCA50_014696 [Cerrena zonata]|uniref:Metallo-beta-lactamase domain-containing protein n=1 Tax=Cerrena zonata TaxID=2478898 RepID=A0AAW0FL05_9APHY